MSAMTNTRIAVTRRRLKRLQEDRPFFLERIEDFSSEQKVLEISIFDKSINEAQEEPANGLAKTSGSDQ